MEIQPVKIFPIEVIVLNHTSPCKYNSVMTCKHFPRQQDKNRLGLHFLFPKQTLIIRPKGKKNKKKQKKPTNKKTKKNFNNKFLVFVSHVTSQQTRVSLNMLTSSLALFFNSRHYHCFPHTKSKASHSKIMSIRRKK